MRVGVKNVLMCLRQSTQRLSLIAIADLCFDKWKKAPKIIFTADEYLFTRWWMSFESI